MDYLFSFAWCVFFIVVAIFSIADVLIYQRDMERHFIVAEVVIFVMCAIIAAYLLCRLFAM